VRSAFEAGCGIFQPRAQEVVDLDAKGGASHVSFFGDQTNAWRKTKSWANRTLLNKKVQPRDRYGCTLLEALPSNAFGTLTSPAATLVAISVFPGPILFAFHPYQTARRAVIEP
jgi:hypothetical protein